MSAYWNERARSYSWGVQGELSGDRCSVWVDAMLGQKEPQGTQALDLGCGPGFFTALLSDVGCSVTAVDASAAMLAEARKNTRALGLRGISFFQSNATDLPFADESFDLAVCRNLTWLLDDPVAAYREWHRVLAPGGVLVVFDANWYRYLVDPVVAARRALDQGGGSDILGWDDEALASYEQERRCEQLALGVPLTYELRPQWDRAVLEALGFSTVDVDCDVWRRVWTTGEQAFYASSPLFCIRATK